MRRLYLNICLKRRFLFWADTGKSICLLMRDSTGWQQVLKKSYISGSIWRKWVIQTVKYSIIKDMFCYISFSDAPFIFSNFFLKNEFVFRHAPASCLHKVVVLASRHESQNTSAK